MYFWVNIIACPMKTRLYINHTTNGFTPVVQKSIIDVMILVRTINQLSIFQDLILGWQEYFIRVSSIFINPTSLLYESILVDTLVYFQAYILASEAVYFSRVSCLFFNPTSSLQKQSILVESLVNFSFLHPRFVSIF